VTTPALSAQATPPTQLALAPVGINPSVPVTGYQLPTPAPKSKSNGNPTTCPLDDVFAPPSKK
jgi:hypothetical protein